MPSVLVMVAKRFNALIGVADGLSCAVGQYGDQLGFVACGIVAVFQGCAIGLGFPG